VRYYWPDALRYGKTHRTRSQAPTADADSLGQESHDLTAEDKLKKILHYRALKLDVARAGL
jgi:hypothetical protein